MQHRKSILIFLLVMVALVVPLAAQAASFADPAFEAVWQRTDELVKQGSVARTWLWGPGPGPSRTEPYLESSQGQRRVQYFEKSRMEINNPTAPRDQWYVSNGLIVQEMASGRIQTGDALFEPHDRASIPVAGDLSGNVYPPTYASFGQFEPHLQTGERAVNLLGQPVTAIWAADSPGGVDMDKATQYPETKVAFYDETPGLNIPGVFWTFMNQPGRVLDNGQGRTATPMFDWLYVLGHPITESYWTRIKVGGAERDVLIQLYERRVLTYTPSNPAGWKVEMGNVGQHYYQWRYGTPMP